MLVLWLGGVIAQALMALASYYTQDCKLTKRDYIQSAGAIILWPPFLLMHLWDCFDDYRDRKAEGVKK